MKSNHLFIFNINELHTYFRGLMKIDFYDSRTLEWFSRNILKEMSLQELFKMEDTIIKEINKGNRSNSNFWAGLGVLIALFVGIFAILISLYSAYEVDYGTSPLWVSFVLIAILAVISIAILVDNLIGKKLDKTHDLIRLLIYLKENEQDT